MSKPYILVSSCLLGLPTQYNTNSKKIELLVQWVKEGKLMFVCPEQVGGLPTPREPAEIESGKTAKQVLDGEAAVLTKSGEDVTKEYIRGARIALDMCKEYGIKIAILKARSPSCGSLFVYDGSYSGSKVKGRGVTAELLIQEGIKVYNEENFPKDL